MPTIEMIVLAKSKKKMGRCIAGLRTDGKGWVRPVAPSPDGTLFTQHYTLTNGSEAEVLDVVKVEFIKPRPEPHQPENWLISNRTWKLVARPGTPEHQKVIGAHIVSGPTLLGNQSDRVPINKFKESPAKSSLALVIPKKIEWMMTEDIRGNPQVRGVFKLEKVEYNLAVTDQKWKDRLKDLKEGIYPIEKLKSIGLKPSDKFLLTVSLGEPFPWNNPKDHFKLIASVIFM